MEQRHLTTSLKGNSHANKQNWPGGRASEVLGHPEGLLSWGDLLGMEYLGGYRGEGDQMPYRPRLQERRASSRPHFWFWFLMVDDCWTEQQTVEEGAPEPEWASQARTSLQQTGFMYNFMHTHIKSQQWEHCLLFLIYIIRNGFNFPTRTAVDCHGHLQKNNNNP